MNKKEVINMLRDCYDKAIKESQKSAETYIAWNPGQAENRKRDLLIERIGINNLYYLMFDELNKK